MIEQKDTRGLFEHLSNLYRADPAQFEEQRKLLIEQAIESFPPAERLRAYGMQFHIDGHLSRYKDPVVRMNKMVEIFWEQFERFCDVLNNPGKVIEERKGADGKVLPFRYPPNNSPN